MSEISIVLADDHAVVRAGLRLLLDLETGMTVLTEAGTTDEAARLVAERQPDVVVLDLNMPASSGESGGPGATSLDALPRISRESPNTRVVILTMQDDPQFARAALAAGAAAYVLKEAADTELVEAVRRAAAGGVYLNPQIGARLAASGDEADGHTTLSKRELEVLRLIALGHTNNEVAGRLFLSVRTVESHRAHIQRKLGLATRAELVRHALDHGMLG